ncbi:MAG: hypothetical protein ACI9S9_005072 [Planctomycetota bacterium]|jgi:hypothetical protein
MPLTIGGVNVPVGMYYAVLRNDQMNGLELLLLDPHTVRKQRLDAYEANKTTGGIAIPLKREHLVVQSPRLTIELTVDRSKRDHGELHVTFGPHRLRTDVKMHPHRK